MTAHLDVLRQCLQEAASAAKPALERCIDAAIAELQVLEVHCMRPTERDVLANCWRYLQGNKLAWSEGYAAALHSEFAESLLTPSPAPLPAKGSVVAARTDGARQAPFSLLDDAQVNQVIDSQRLLAHLLPGVEQTLTELDALTSSALGLTHVVPERNPLRPGVFARVLQQLMAGTLADAPLAAMGVKHLASPLTRELQLVYKKAAASLKEALVPAAPYQVNVQASVQVHRQHALPAVPQPSLGASEFERSSGSQTWPGDDFGRQGFQAEAQYADLSNRAVQAALLDDFLNHGSSNVEHGLTPNFYANIDQELAELAAAPPTAAPLPAGQPAAGSQLSAVDRPARFVDASSPLNEQVWGAYGTPLARSLVRSRLKKEATKVGQVLGMDVVRQLVNQVAQDPRLLAPVREAIVALEPSLLRLAMLDPRFFSDESHPGRRLMERVAQRSFKYNDEYSPEFQTFFQVITHSFTELNAQKIDQTKSFDVALSTLENGWDEQDQRESAQRQKVVQALRFAQDRQSQADQIAFDLSTRSDLDQVPGVVLDFLFGPWALAMAHARLTDKRQQVDPEGFGSVVPDLLWSAKRDVTLKSPAKLIDMIPSLLQRLHSGLAMLGQEPKDNEAFFESLMKLHRPVLRLRRLKSQRDAEESAAVPLAYDELPAIPSQRLEKLRSQSGQQPWLGRDDLNAAGFEDTLPTAPTDLLMLDGRPDAAAQNGAFARPDTTANITPDTTPNITPDITPNIAPNISPNTTADITADTLPSAPSDTNAVAHAGAAISQQQAEALLLSLQAGSWIDLYSKHRWLRAQLVWASSKATLFMFTSHGGQPHSMTKRSCEKLITQRWLRRVETHGVVAQALEAVALDAAMQTRQLAAQSPDMQSEFETA